jgi:hypothetical protein
MDWHVSSMLAIIAALLSLGCNASDLQQPAEPMLVPVSLSAAAPNAQLKCPKLEAVCREFWPRPTSSFSELLHAIHAFKDAPDAWTRDKTPSIQEIQSILLDYERAAVLFGERSSIVQTPYGLHFATPRSADIAAQAHIDQALTILADLGIKANQPIAARGIQGTVKDLLADTTANFQTRGEFEWSALALLQYYPSRKIWSNRFGETFDYDKVSSKLMSRPLHMASCGGAHVLTCLAAILQCDAQEPLLSPRMRSAVTSYLANMMRYVSNRQLPDGSIDPAWNLQLRAQPWYVETLSLINAKPMISRVERLASEQSELLREDDDAQLLYTSHLAEWALYLPLDMQPEPDFYSRAARFLYHQLLDADAKFAGRNYCPYSHAIAVLVVLNNSKVQKGGNIAE